MDVTSLLNAPATTAEESKAAEQSQTPSHTRTPWDAGGYTLPVNSHHKPDTATKPGEEAESRESSVFTHPFGHKFSDSRSSLSSFSSSTSNNHSRLSSTSTVSGFHPSSGTISDLPKPSEAPSEGRNRHTTPPQKHASLEEVSPTNCLNTLATVAERRLQLQIPEIPPRGPTSEPIMRTRSMIQMDIAPHEMASLSRANSPSDAMLIKRPGRRQRSLTPAGSLEPLDEQQE
jgi:hypothetical protein